MQSSWNIRKCLYSSVSYANVDVNLLYILFSFRFVCCFPKLLRKFRQVLHDQRKINAAAAAAVVVAAAAADAKQL